MAARDANARVADLGSATSFIALAGHSVYGGDSTYWKTYE